MDLTPTDTVKFTVTRAPQREAQRKTIQRLMRMQTEVQGGLSKLHQRRKVQDNIHTTRAGRPWIVRKRTTKLTRVEPGESFTLHITPQIMPDLRSVEKFLDAEKVAS